MHKFNLVGTLLQYKTLSGHFVQDGDKVMQVGELPMTTVPMCAPFVPQTTELFLSSLQAAVNYVKSTDNDSRAMEPVDIVIPIRSQGGNIAELNRIRSAIEAHKRELWPGTNTRRFHFVTFGIGTVASCGFVLFMEGDERISVDEAQYLCHEPRCIKEAPTTPIVETGSQMLRQGCALESHRKQLYRYAELAMFGEDHDCVAREEWKRKHADVLQRIHCETTGKMDSMLCEWDCAHTQLFDYLTRVVGENTDDMFLSCEWMLCLGVAHERVADMYMKTTECYECVE